MPAPMTHTSVRRSLDSAGASLGGLVTIQKESVPPVSLSINPPLGHLADEPGIVESGGAKNDEKMSDIS
jgi:hypothetical protein